MKKKFKRINRGLVLAAIALIAVIIYITIDYSQFSKEKPIISNLVENYIKDTIELIPTNQPVNDLRDDKILTARKDVVDKYWCTKTPSENQSYATTKTNLISTIKDFYTASNSEDKGYIKDATIKISNIAITKNGPGVAKVTCTADVNLTATNQCEFISFTDREFIYRDDVSTEGITDLSKGAGAIYMQQQYDCTFFIYREGGAWKIGSGNAFSYMSTTSISKE